MKISVQIENHLKLYSEQLVQHKIIQGLNKFLEVKLFICEHRSGVIPLIMHLNVNEWQRKSLPMEIVNLLFFSPFYIAICQNIDLRRNSGTI